MDDPSLQFASDHLYYQKQLPNREDLVAFSCWRHSLDHIKGITPTASDCIARISDTRYNDPMEVDYLMKLLDHPEPVYMLLGEHRGFGYRVKPFPTVLEKRFVPPKTQESDDRNILPHMYLGLNRTIELPSRDGTLRRDSILSTGRTNDDTGFVFFQVGLLEYADYQQWALRKEGLLPANMVWQYTNYVVVVQLNEKSHSEDVWLVCYYRPQVHIVLGKPTPNKNDEYDSLDLLPSDRTHGKRRPAARIAKNFRDLGEDTVINIPDPGTDDVLGPFELVPAVLEGQGKDQVIVRQYITQVKPDAADENEKSSRKEKKNGDNVSDTKTAVPEIKIQPASDES